MVIAEGEGPDDMGLYLLSASGSWKSRSASSFASSLFASPVSCLSQRVRVKPSVDSSSSAASGKSWCAWMQLRAVRKVPAILKAGSKVHYIRVYLSELSVEVMKR